MLDIKMKDENTSWQEWYEQNPKPRRQGVGVRGPTQSVGVNDLDYVTLVKVDDLVVVYKCRFHTAWTSMLARCYSKSWLDKYPSYVGASVSEEFKLASSFVGWMKSQVSVEGGEKLQLDKDILFPGNKLYSRETCAFVPQFVNLALRSTDSRLDSVLDRYMGMKCFREDVMEALLSRRE